MSKLTSKIMRHLRGRYHSTKWAVTNKVHEILLRGLNLRHCLTTGIEVKISSFADWAIYNDIFVDGEYDLAIRQVFRESKGPLRVLDLGANVGLFLKRLLHIRRSEFPNIAVELICLEGCPETFRILQAQAPHTNSLESFRLIHGLAGKRTGHAYLQKNPFHAMSRLSGKPNKRGTRVDFVDLSGLTAHWDSIDMVKCDIEGAEQMVLESYSDVLSKTRLGVFEFHLDRIDYGLCLKQAQQSGLSNRRVLHGNNLISVEILFREGAVER